MTPRDVVRVMQAVVDRPAHEAGAVRVLGALDVSFPVGICVPSPAVRLAVSHILNVANTSSDVSGNSCNRHAIPS